MSRKHLLLMIVFDILVPISAGAIIWNLQHEPINSLLVTILVTILSIVVQTHLALQQPTQKPAFDAAKELLNNINTLWNRNPNQLYRSLLESKIEKITSDVGQESFYGSGGEIERIGVELTKRMRRGAYLTFLANLQNEWSSAEKYFENLREVVKQQNLKVARVFICDDAQLENPSLLKFISEDTRSNIDTYIVLSSEVDTQDREILMDFGIWDEQLLCLVSRAASGEAVRCEYTTEERKLAMAKSWRDELMKYAKPPQELLKQKLPRNLSDSLYEVEESASMVEEVSRKCSSRFLGGQKCSWYHSAWQYLRLLDMVATPDWHEQFYAGNLSQVLLRSEKPPKILICGVADYGMLSHVVKALKTLRIYADITVLDICQTPLDACQWYADKHQIKITTVCDSILNFKQENSFDCIVTDEFLTVVNHRMRQPVVEQWNKLLKPRGTVITTALIRENGASSDAATEAQREDYEKRCRASAIKRAYLVWPKLAYDEIVTMARKYAENMVNHYFHNEEEIRELFEEFQIIELVKKETPGEFLLPTYSFEIVAEKPDENPI